MGKVVEVKSSIHIIRLIFLRVWLYLIIFEAFLDAIESPDMNVAGNWDVSIQKFSYDMYILHHYIFRVKKSKIQKLKTQCVKHLNVAPRH